MPISRQKSVFDGNSASAAEIMQSVKHSFDSLSKRRFLAPRHGVSHHKAMLKDNDADRHAMAVRLRAAIGEESGRQRQIADRCHVTPQAVTGWLRTGRISKRHLPIVAQMTGRDLLWLMTGRSGADPSANTAPLVSAPGEADALPRLTPRQQALLGYFDGLTEAQQDAVLRELQEKKQLNDALVAELLQRRKAS